MSELKKRKLGLENEENKDGSDTLLKTQCSQSAKKEVASASPSSGGSNKPVFGASSTFGKASIFENMKNGKNVFDSPVKDSTKDASAAAPVTPTTSFGSFGSTFGSNSKFSNAFQKASQKKSFLDEPEVSNSQTGSPSSSTATQQYKQVDLAVKEVKTGEENELSIFSTTSKLFELSLTKISEGWKERGVGPLHLNRSIVDPSQIRIVMRSHGLLRVILNYKITPTTILIKGLDASLSPGKFIRINSVSGDGTPVQYLLKFSDQTVRDGLCDKVASLQAECKSTPIVHSTETAVIARDDGDAKPAKASSSEEDSTDVDSDDAAEDKDDEKNDEKNDEKDDEKDDEKSKN